MPLFNNIKQETKDIVEWMKLYSESSQNKGYVIGLSGGVDSSVVAALAVEAIGAENVHGVIMPIDSNSDDETDAIQVAGGLGITYNIVDMTESYNGMINVYPYDKQHRVNDILMKSNIKARLRMTMLYQFAGEMNYLVAGTGNRSEDSIGYFTKYGDGGVDILPVAQFYKWEIRQFALHLGLPEKIAFRVSTAGLYHGQTDEEELGITYEVLDNFLMYIDKQYPVKLMDEAHDRFHELMTLVVKNYHKSEYPPIYKRERI